MNGASGGYYVTVTTTVAGTYPMNVYAGGLKTATRSVVVAPGKPVLTDCVVSGEGVGEEDFATVGRLSEIRLRGRDRFSNPAPISAVDVEGVSFVVDITVVVSARGGGTNRVSGVKLTTITPFAPVGLEAPGRLPLRTSFDGHPGGGQPAHHLLWGGDGRARRRAKDSGGYGVGRRGTSAPGR